MFELQSSRPRSHLLLLVAVTLVLFGESCVSAKGGRGGRGRAGRVGGGSTSIGRSAHSSSSHSYASKLNTNHAANHEATNGQGYAVGSSQQGSVGAQTDLTRGSTSKKSQSGDATSKKQLDSQTGLPANEKPGKKTHDSETVPDQHKRTDKNERKDENGRSRSNTRRNRKGHKKTTTTTPLPPFI